ncbi:hypothetical protein J7I93_22450 [Bacillus sp. ISL-47]|nr:hypothetical protein [Bacillus sp. ISL-47]
MKKIIFWMISACAVLFLGVLAYFASMEMISDKVMAEVAGSITEGDIEMLSKDPSVKELIKKHSKAISTMDLDKTSLPITTKEEAVEKISQDFSVEEIRQVASKVKDGLTSEEEKEIYSLLNDRLTEEELTALKIIAIQEMQK